MPRDHVWRFLGLLCVSLIGLLPTASLADHAARYVRADGVFVYLGVVRAEIIKNRPRSYPELHARGGVPSGENDFYVTVVLFDSADGRRITDAEVKVRASPFGLAGRRKQLDPVSIAGAESYGSCFNIGASDVYVIKVEIRRPEISDVIRTQFEYKSFHH